MKKFYALLLAAVMVISLAACGKGAEAEYKLGMGVVVANGSKTGTAQIDATVATVVTDKDGKIVACRLDVAQTKLKIDDGVAQDASAVDLRSKHEKGNDYNMKGSSGIGKEWMEQAEFFQNAVVGKTGDQVKAMATEEKNGHTVSTDADILAGCTMSIADFKEAIVKACKDEYAKSFKSSADSFKLGLGVLTAVDSSTKSATAEADGAANLYSNFSASVTDKDGKLLAVLVDAIQPKIAFSATGEITKFTFNGTKKELKDGYNMKGASPIAKEWMDQATFFENAMVGKSAADVKGLATEKLENGHVVSTDKDILAGCTISIADFKDVIGKAIANEK